MKAAVIILNWNGEALLREFLPAVIKNTDQDLARVIVVDNGSTDGSREILAKEFPQVETLFFDKNYGFAEGYNRAIAQIGAPISILLNSDVAPAKGWVAPLLDCLDHNPDVAACQPKLLAYKDKTRFEYAGASGGFLDRYGYPYCRGRIFGTCEQDMGQYDDPCDISWASGAALVIRTDAYLKAGGLDASFFAHMEEIDLCWRIRRMGWRIMAEPRSVVYHLGGGSLPVTNPKKTYLNFRNNLLMLYKNLPKQKRNRILFIRRCLDTIAILRYALTLDFANAKAIIKAHKDYRKMVREQYSGKSVPFVGLHHSAAVSAPAPFLLLQYYLLRRHTYSQLPHRP